MADETKVEVLETDVEPGQALPETPPETEATKYTEPQPEYVTSSQLAEMEERLSRLMQSQKDKSAHEIKKTVDEKLDRLTKQLKAAGVEISEARAAQMREEIAIETVNQLEQDGPQAQEVQPRPALDFKMQARIARAEADVRQRVAELGFDLYAGDPELKNVNANAPDPETWAKSVLQALNTKAVRTGAASQAQAPVQKASPAARIVPDGTPAGDQQQQLLNELAAERAKPMTHASMKRRKEIAEELKQFD